MYDVWYSLRLWLTKPMHSQRSAACMAVSPDTFIVVIIAKLDQFHVRCLRQIAYIKWQDVISNTAQLSSSAVRSVSLQPIR